ncbi:hypothetical protein AMJ80_02850 [bacterium SM23_31]|nr:MAG: hypothetical protein AMJ80_02850 [bacterium SM23_31]
MKKLIGFFSVIIFALALFAGCSKDSEDSIIAPGDSEANRLAREGFDLLINVLQYAEDIDIGNANESGDIFPETYYLTIKGKFTQAMAQNPTNALANLGMGIVEVLSVNYDTELWDIVSDFDDEFAEKRILNNQMNFIAETPKLYLKYFAHSLDDPEISFARIQTYIDNNVIPKLDNSLEHLAYAITLADDNVLLINDGEEDLELDRGEIYLFRASVFATNAAFKLLTLYDMDLFDAAGTYNWVDAYDIDDDYFWGPSYYRTEMIEGSKWLFAYYNYSLYEAKIDSLLFSVLKHNLQNRNTFLSYRSGKSPVLIKTDLEDALQDIQSAVDYIFDESDNQSDDIIKISHLTDINDEISDHSPGYPQFSQNWSTIYDVIDWLEVVLNNPYDIEEGGVFLQVDISKLFNPGISDWKDKLPYHNWRNENEWITVDSSFYTYPNYGNSYWIWFDNDWVVIDSVDYVMDINYDYDVFPIEFLDGLGGNVVNLEVDFPYFPDYTFSGLFPGMTREQMIYLIVNK